MIRVPLPGADLTAERHPLPPETAHYLHRVRRLGPGDPVRLFDGAGHEADATLGGDPDALWAERTGPVETGRRGAPVTLVYGLPKGDKLETVARQITELGAARLILLDARRSVVRLTGPRAAKRRDRLARIMAEAARQSGRADTPALLGPVDLAAALDATADCPTRWVLHPDAPHDPDAPPPTAPLAIFVGPEGGFDPDEIAALAADGVRPLRLDCPVLRTETAAPVALALALERLGML